jgi:cysteine-rich repeat protein
MVVPGTWTISTLNKARFLGCNVLLLLACGCSRGLSVQSPDAAVSADGAALVFPGDAQDSTRDRSAGVVIVLDVARPETANRPDPLLCGNSVRDRGEACDDGNTISGDGCAANCDALERGWRCPALGGTCVSTCGDGVRAGHETCDDGNTVSGDGCSHICLTEPGWDCSNGTCLPSPSHGSLDSGVGQAVCGDGITSETEECDDGALNDDQAYGGCTTDCKLGPRCGDGWPDSEHGESCDLGDMNGKRVYFSEVSDAGTSSVLLDPGGIVWCTSDCQFNPELALCVICPGIGCLFCD